jgi:hypothetical protein
METLIYDQQVIIRRLAMSNLNELSLRIKMILKLGGGRHSR